MLVGPSTKQAEWRDFLSANAWNPADFAALVTSDDVGAAAFEVETSINGLYRAVQRAQAITQQFGGSVNPDMIGEVQLKARWLSANFEPFREALGPAQRDLDLQLMRWMRRASCLSAVIGAGATMDAGGPSWSSLVRRLLELVLERGKETWEMRRAPESTPEHTVMKRVVTAVDHLADDKAREAREVLSHIALGTATTDILMTGAQLCYDFLGQHLFTDITAVLYEKDRKPGAIHQAIAELAAPIEVKDRGGWFNGWHALVTYNFDDLMGEALDAVGLPRAAYAMRGTEVAGDPNELARKQGQQALHHRILHLHGYTPRKFFLITTVRFVFSTSQYEATYGGARVGIIGDAFDQCLANPVHHALYVGCSFQDGAMNDLLREAANALPGRYHYALLKWPGGGKFGEASADEVARHGAEFIAMGVRPIWFESFGEIPELIRTLA